jgi:hypothetical protein
MITLKTLDQATAQEVFDQVANHLLTQNQQSKSKGESNCVYRTDDGLKCAAGCLIGDDEYHSGFDNTDDVGTTWRSLIQRGLVKTSKHSELITDLQNLHDNRVVFNWRSELMFVAKRYSLTTNF